MKSWVTAFLIVALAIVGYLWYASSTGRNQMAQDIKNTPGQVENKVGQVTDKTGQLVKTPKLAMIAINPVVSTASPTKLKIFKVTPKLLVMMLLVV